MVALASALVADSPIMLLGEPTRARMGQQRAATRAPLKPRRFQAG